MFMTCEQPCKGVSGVARNRNRNLKGDGVRVRIRLKVQGRFRCAESRTHQPHTSACVSLLKPKNSSTSKSTDINVQ